MARASYKFLASLCQQPSTRTRSQAHNSVEDIPMQIEKKNFTGSNVQLFVLSLIALITPESHAYLGELDKSAVDWEAFRFLLA